MQGFVKHLARKILRRKSRSLQERYPLYHFGRGTYDDNDLRVYRWGASVTLQVGDFSSFGRGVQIFLGGNHRMDWVTTYPFSVFWEKAKHIKGHPASRGDVKIGSDVWIGSEAMILSGVTIGNGAVVGARSVVTKDVPDYSIVAGNPAQFIRKRFGEEVIEALQEIKWWDWDDAQIEKYLPLLLSSDTAAFIRNVEESRSCRD
ncbi:MAG: CatB-related O-acetyltransferase [Sedimentisphaerales bacterium]|nr:CatB-related O-acetyltransferase [Sedimentisphaerales bacterium]